MRYWLMKSEPSSFSIDDLKARKSTLWDGVRNFQARNFMTNEMKVGDQVVFYHSNAEPPGAAGVAEVSGAAEPDPTAFDPDSKYYDPKSTPANPIWHCVRIKFKKRFRRLVSLEEMRNHKGLVELPLLRKGNRLSVQPVGKKEFEIICALGDSKESKD
jgi:predicted RNA-binding protein with PUA-like domain